MSSVILTDWMRNLSSETANNDHLCSGPALHKETINGGKETSLLPESLIDACVAFVTALCLILSIGAMHQRSHFHPSLSSDGSSQIQVEFTAPSFLPLRFHGDHSTISCSTFGVHQQLAHTHWLLLTFTLFGPLMVCT